MVHWLCHVRDLEQHNLLPHGFEISCIHCLYFKTYSKYNFSRVVFYNKKDLQCSSRVGWVQCMRKRKRDVRKQTLEYIILYKPILTGLHMNWLTSQASNSQLSRHVFTYFVVYNFIDAVKDCLTACYNP